MDAHLSAVIEHHSVEDLGQCRRRHIVVAGIETALRGVGKIDHHRGGVDDIVVAEEEGESDNGVDTRHLARQVDLLRVAVVAAVCHGEVAVDSRRGDHRGRAAKGVC